MSQYMLHSIFGKAFSGVIGENFGAYTFILPLPCLLNICLSFWMFYRRKIYLNKIKILGISANKHIFFLDDKSTRVVLFEFSQQSSAKCRGKIILLIVRVN